MCVNTVFTLKNDFRVEERKEIGDLREAHAAAINLTSCAP